MPLIRRPARTKGAPLSPESSTPSTVVRVFASEPSGVKLDDELVVLHGYQVLGLRSRTSRGIFVARDLRPVWK